MPNKAMRMLYALLTLAVEGLGLFTSILSASIILRAIALDDVQWLFAGGRVAIAMVSAVISIVCYLAYGPLKKSVNLPQVSL